MTISGSGQSAVPGPPHQRAGQATHGKGTPRLLLESADAVLIGLDGVLIDAAGPGQAARTAVVNDLLDQRRGAADQRPAPPALSAPPVFPGATRLLRGLHAAGVPAAVVTSSRHGAELIAVAGLGQLIDVVVDGRVAAAMGLADAPDPATYREAAARLGADPAKAVVIERTVAGVMAGRRGGFWLVIGIAGADPAAPLAAAGADLVAGDISDIELAGTGPLADGWHVTYRPTGEKAEGMRETLCTLGNGYLATRGARTWAHDDGVQYPGTYLAGVYDRMYSDLAGRPVEHESIVNVPNWLPLSFSAEGGRWLGEAGAVVSDEELRLDLRAGVLLRRLRVTDPAGRRTLVTERRLVSMADAHLAAVELVLVAENWAGRLRVRSAIEGTCCTDQTAEERLLSHCHLTLAGSGEEAPGTAWLAARTSQSGTLIAVAARTRITGAAGPGRYRESGRSAGHEWEVRLGRGASCHVEKAAAYWTSKDAAVSDPVVAARQAAADAPRFADLLAAHEAAWARLWSRARTEVQAAGRPAGVVNLHLFHLMQVASPHAAAVDAGLGARGLHGEGYLGHVFWDELFVFRFLNLRFPEASRALLAYRHRRLPAARRTAREAGEAGARFPWQSGSDGRDETPVMLFNPLSGRWMPDRSAAQRHVGLAVAYNCWRYAEATGDDAFLREAGAEIIFEVARHFAGLADFDETLGRWRIRGVMGPDEFHDGYPWTSAPGVDDNAYTNVLASWVLARTVELAGMLAADRREEALDRLGISQADIQRFGEVSRGLHVPFHGGVISQFAGYDRLAPIDLNAYRARYGNIGRLDLILEAEGDTVRRYQAGKQADTLMLLYLFSPAELAEIFRGLGYELSRECIRRTIDYYTERVTHGSTLSRVVHAWVAARADRAASWHHFTDALAADMADTQGGTTAEGIHLGAMAGTIDLLQRCYPGLELHRGALHFDPALPDEVASLRLDLAYRGHRLDVTITRDEIIVASAPCQAAPVTVVLAGQRVTLRPGQRARRRFPGPAAYSVTGARKAGDLDDRDSASQVRTDPVCGMVVERSAAAGRVTRDGLTYYFCSPACQERFEADPRQYATGDG